MQESSKREACPSPGERVERRGGISIHIDCIGCHYDLYGTHSSVCPECEMQVTASLAPGRLSFQSRTFTACLAATCLCILSVPIAVILSAVMFVVGMSNVYWLGVQSWVDIAFPLGLSFALACLASHSNHRLRWLFAVTAALTLASVFTHVPRELTLYITLAILLRTTRVVQNAFHLVIPTAIIASSLFWNGRNVHALALGASFLWLSAVCAYALFAIIASYKNTQRVSVAASLPRQ